MNECLKGPLVRLTHGLVAPGVNDLCYADDGSRLQQRNDIFIMDGEAQRHVWLTPLYLIRGLVNSSLSRRLFRNSCISGLPGDDLR